MPRSKDVTGDQIGVFAAALAPLRDRFPQRVVEREILRVVATIRADSKSDVLSMGRDEVLTWARNRLQETLPMEAWQGEDFEALAAGRTTMASRVVSGESVLWSLRGDDPDKSVPGRIWSTEVSLGRTSDQDDVRLGVRLVVNSAEPELEIEPAVPGLVRQIADSCGLIDGSVPIRSSAHFASQDEHLETLVEWIESSTRRLPILVATGDEREDNPDQPFIDVNLLGKSLCGLAHVVSVPSGLTYHLSDRFGKELAVFHGGIRTYQADFRPADDPRDHRLILGYMARREPQRLVAELRRSIARQSLRRSRLGHDVLSFAAVRSASLQSQKERETESGVDQSVSLETSQRQIEALQQQIKELQGQFDQALQLSEEESSRAEGSEKQLQSAWARIETLEAALTDADQVPDTTPLPASWDEFVEWCDHEFSGRLSLAPAARRGIRKAVYEDIANAAKGIGWLANDARSRFLKGGGTLANIPVFDGITNAPCGSDEYTFDFQGRRLSANWHLKNGGNTRKPERCLRIYYAFDDQTRQIVISDMPAHLRTDAS